MPVFDPEIFSLFHRKWALLTAGTPERFNTMTVGWGGLGTLWGKPVVTVYVKPIRYTHEFMEESERFTLTFFGEEHRAALSLLGSRSGREGDKIAAAGLTPVFFESGVGFREAQCTIFAKKIYRQDLDRSAIPEDALARYYNGEPAHTLYVGEVTEVRDE